MNIKIERQSILPTLNLVSSVVEKRQTLPILANLYFNLTDGSLNLIGTDLEVEISETIENVQGDNGVFTVSTRKILDICRMLPEDATISLDYDNEKVIVKSGRSRYTLKTLPSADFPRIETGNWEERLKIKQLDLKRLLEKTSFAMAVQDVRYYLNGVLFELGDNQLKVIATDGHRLAQSYVNTELSITDKRQLIIPRKAILEISRFLDGDADSEITLEMSRNHLKLTKGNTVMITKLIDGKFPEFKGVLETACSVVLNLNRSTLLETLTRVAVLTTDRFKGVRVAVSNGLLKVTANNPEQEEAVEEIEIDYSGDDIETGYNVSYLIDAAKVIQDDVVEMRLQGNDGICILKQQSDDASTWLIMPMRI